MTINRWLSELEKQGLVKKIYGGAITLSKEKSYISTEDTQLLETKKNIARYAVTKFIKKDHTYFLEAGGTVYEMLPFIQEKSITIITNAIHIVYSVNKYIQGANVMCTGGIVRPNSMSIVGKVAESTLDNFHAHILFFSVQALSENGLLDADMFESSMKRKMIKQSDKVVLLADSSKMNKTSTEVVTSYKDIDELNYRQRTT